MLQDDYAHNFFIYSKADKKKMYAFLYDVDLQWNGDLELDNPGYIVWKKLYNLYFDEIKDRYWELRKSILNEEHLSNILISLQSAVPYSDWKLEKNKWEGSVAINNNANINWILKNRFSSLDVEFQ